MKHAADDSGGQSEERGLAIVRRLIERQSGADRAASVQSACADVCRDLSRWLGPGGCRALITRALALSARSHPALTAVRVCPDGPTLLEGVDEAMAAAGPEATAAALEAMLIELVALLSRLIGEDMVENLVDHNSRGASTNDAGKDDS